MLADTVTFTDHGTGYYPADTGQFWINRGIFALAVVLVVIGVIVLWRRHRS
jgi:hypothetical protein